MVVYINIFNNSATKYVEIIYNCTKVKGYKTFDHISLNWQQIGKWNLKHVICSSIKVDNMLWIIPNQNVQAWHTKYYKIMQSEIKEDLHKWQDVSGSLLGRCVVVRVWTLPVFCGDAMLSRSNSNRLL